MLGDIFTYQSLVERIFEKLMLFLGKDEKMNFHCKMPSSNHGTEPIRKGKMTNITVGFLIIGFNTPWTRVFISIKSQCQE